MNMKKLISSLLAGVLTLAPMAQQVQAAQAVIGVGTTANDGTGDTLRAALGKTNSNFGELYGVTATTAAGVASNAAALVPLGGKLTPVATPYLGNVVTGAGVMTGNNASIFYEQTRFPVYTKQPLSTGVVVLVSCAYLKTGAAATNEEVINATATHKVSLEDMAGNISPITFAGGAATGSCANAVNGVLPSDPMTMTATIPAGQLFFKDLYSDTTNGILLRSGGIPVSQGASFEYSTGALTDRSATAGQFASTGTVSNASGNSMPPLGILAQTTLRSFLLVGDSRCAGLYDFYEGTNVDVGNTARGIGPLAPYINACLGSDQIAYLNASHSFRSQLDNYVSDVAFPLGTNDISAGTTLANLQTLTGTARGYFSAAHKFHIPTIEPRSSLTLVTIGTLTANGNGLIATGVPSTIGLATGEVINISGATPTTDNGPCLITQIVSATSFACINPNATGTAAATGTVQFTDGGGFSGFQTIDPNQAVLAGYNRWRRAQVVTPTIAGYWSAPEAGDFVSDGRDSGKWRAYPCSPSTIQGAWYSGSNGAISYDGVHENHCGYNLIGRGGVYSAPALNFLLQRDLDPIGHANDNSPAFLAKAG